MTTFINTDDFSAYTELSLEQTRKALVDGRSIVCWWYDSHGDRNEETVVFTEFNYLRTAENG